MKSYFDTCSLQRPLDSKQQIRVVLEAEAILGVIAVWEKGQIELVSSEVLVYEVMKTTHPIRREYAENIFSKIGEIVPLNEEITFRAKEFVEYGIKSLDALHLASAEWAKVDFFCTCDDRFLSKAKKIKNLNTMAVSPIELIEELEI